MQTERRATDTMKGSAIAAMVRSGWPNTAIMITTKVLRRDSNRDALVLGELAQSISKGLDTENVQVVGDASNALAKFLDRTELDAKLVEQLKPLGIRAIKFLISGGMKSSEVAVVTAGYLASTLGLSHAEKSEFGENAVQAISVLIMADLQGIGFVKYGKHHVFDYPIFAEALGVSNEKLEYARTQLASEGLPHFLEL